MKKYKVNNLNIEKFLHQNKGEIISCIDGTLIDNYLIENKRGYIILMETYVNCWTSNYSLLFSTDVKAIDKIWNDLAYKYNEMMG